jgi:hypothetical protein
MLSIKIMINIVKNENIQYLLDIIILMEEVMDAQLT